MYTIPTQQTISSDSPTSGYATGSFAKTCNLYSWMKTSPAIWTPQLQDLLSVPLQECSRTCYVSDIWQDSIFKRKCSALFSHSTQ